MSYIENALRRLLTWGDENPHDLYLEDLKTIYDLNTILGDRICAALCKLDTSSKSSKDWGLQIKQEHFDSQLKQSWTFPVAKTQKDLLREQECNQIVCNEVIPFIPFNPPAGFELDEWDEWGYSKGGLEAWLPLNFRISHNKLKDSSDMRSNWALFDVPYTQELSFGHSTFEGDDPVPLTHYYNITEDQYLANKDRIEDFLFPNMATKKDEMGMTEDEFEQLLRELEKDIDELKKTGTIKNNRRSANNDPTTPKISDPDDEYLNDNYWYPLSAPRTDELDNDAGQWSNLPDTIKPKQYCKCVTPVPVVLSVLSGLCFCKTCELDIRGTGP